MARPPREDYPGAWHHVMNRGARRAPIFKKDDHCLEFLYGLEMMVEKYGLEVHGYSLLPNHFHLLVRSSPDIANLSRAMGDFLGKYSQRVNAMRRWDGPIFKGRFRSQPIKQERYLLYALAYIHLNSVRAHLASGPEAECWTSHRAYLGLEGCPEWLSCNVLLRQFGGKKGLRKTVNGLHRGSIAWPAFIDLNTGMFDWREAPLESGKKSKESQLPPKPVEVIRQTLKDVSVVTSSKPKDLKRSAMGPRANPARRFAVWALWNTRLLTHRQIARTLDMSVNHVSKLLSRLKKDFPEPLVGWRKAWEDEN